MYKAELKLIM